jgi:two-component system LytT family response regulator
VAQLSALIVDDEPLARRGLRLRLAGHADVTVAGECGNGREALAAIPELNPDLVFLDIQMPGLDGFDVVRSLQGDAMPVVVFVTAFDQFAVRAFEVHAVDYLLKPVDGEHLVRALDRARARLESRKAVREKQQLLRVISDITGKGPAEIDRVLAQGAAPERRYPERIPIRDGGSTTFVPAASIDWVDAAGDYMCLHASGAIHVMRITMKELEAQLDPAVFRRIHRCTIVNMARVEKVCTGTGGEYCVVLKGGVRLKMSRGFRSKVQDLL